VKNFSGKSQKRHNYRKKVKMNTLTLITEGNKINHHYELKSFGIAPSFTGNTIGMRYIAVVGDDEVDEFLLPFINGETGYKIQVDGDNFTLIIKTKCFVEERLRSEKFDYAFIINTEMAS
jgi:hypothetical protein